MPVPPSQELGELGPYVLLQQIAVGGMAEIYLAKTRGVAGFEKFLCLKIIHPNYADDQHFIEMLIDEAKIAVGLNHVNIVQIFDLGREGRTYFIAMEYIDGADLFRVMRRLSEKEIDVPVDVATYIAQEICTGLDYAHRKRDEEGQPLGIIHRDISPQNILLSHSGEVKIVDFGIAKAASRSRRTQAGVIKGKYYYMSPEQAWGDPVDQRTDIFSCGIILYEVLTGQMLYLEEDMHQLLDMVRKADIPRPSTRRNEIPPQLETIVMKALAKRPADRWQTAHEFQAALTNFLFSYAPAYTPARVSRLLELALSEDREESAPREARPPTRQVQLMSRVDFRPITEHSVIFPISDLVDAEHTDESRTAPETLSDDEEDETVDEEDRGERTVISGPPAMMDSSPRLRAAPTSDAASRTQPGEEDAPATSAQFREALPVQQYREALPVKPRDWEEEGPTLINKSSPPLRPQDLELGRPRRKSRSIPVEIVVPRAQPPEAARMPSPPLSENTPTPVVDFSASTVLDAPSPPRPAAPPEPRPTRPSSSMRPPPPPMPPPPPPARQRALTGPAPQVYQPPLSLPQGAQQPPAQPGWPPPPQGQRWPQQQWPQPQQPQQQPPWPQQQQQQWPQQQQQQWPQQQQQQWPQQQQQQWPQQQQQPWPQQQQPAQTWPPQQQPPPPPLQQTWPPQQPPPSLQQTWPPQQQWPQQPAWPAQAASPLSPQQAAGTATFPPESSFGGNTDLIIEQAQAVARRRRRWRTRILAALLGAAILAGAVTVILFLLPSDEKGQVNVISVPEGASVLFDGRPVEKVAPVAIPVPELGRQHTVEVRLKNYKPYQHTLVFAEGETSQQVLAVLTPIFGRLEVRSTPDDADVYVDSTHRGRTPLIIENLTPTGEISVELRRRGYKPVTQVLRWEDRTYMSWEPVLKRSQ